MEVAGGTELPPAAGMASEQEEKEVEGEGELEGADPDLWVSSVFCACQ